MTTDRATKTEGEALVERTARRRLFALGAAGLGVVAGLGLRSNSAAAAHGSPVLGVSSDPAVAGVQGDHHTSGRGVQGTSESGIGVFGFTSEGDTAVQGRNVNLAEGSRGVFGLGKNGVFGAAVHEGGGTGTGVEGTSLNGLGVLGLSVNGIGVKAFSENGTALEVIGKARFSTINDWVVAAKASAAVVPQAQVTGNSHITIALTSDPGNDAVVQWIERDPGVGFTVHLSRAVKDATNFTYFVAEAP